MNGAVLKTIQPIKERTIMLKGLVQQHAGGCLMIVRKNDDGAVSFCASGFLCHSKGYILTCAHSINLSDKLAIIPSLNVNSFNPVTLAQVNVIDVVVSQYNSQSDVALLKITSPSTTITVPENILGDENQILVGSSVGYLGFPFGHSGLHSIKVSSSVISAKNISQTGTNQFQIDAMVHEGNSGGPLIDLASGKIIGIISGRFSPTGNGGSIRIGDHALGTESTISYATTINYGKELMQSEGLNG